MSWLGIPVMTTNEPANATNLPRSSVTTANILPGYG